MGAFVLPRRDPDLWVAELVAQQAGVLGRDQLASCGIDWDRVRNEVAARRWQLAGTHAVVLHNGTLTSMQTLWVACIETGPHAILDGLTAARASGLTGYEPDAIHVSAPKSSRPRPCPGVVVHELRRYRVDDIHPVRTPRQARPAVALLNAALWSATADRACAILAAGVQQRLVRAADLREPLSRIHRHRHRRTILATIGDIEGGSHSLSEIDLVALCRSRRLPVPERQTIRLDARGRRRYLDADWPCYGLAAEVDGGLHMLARTWWNDMDRLNEIVLADRRVLRFPSMVIRLWPDRVAAQLERGLRQGGWHP